MYASLRSNKSMCDLSGISANELLRLISELFDYIGNCYVAGFSGYAETDIDKG